jgi:predicted ArsR family transcriptional regulator
MTSSPRRIDGTREEILALLRRRERMSVDDLSRELRLAGATVRRHLDVLQRDNFVQVTQVRGGTGRPKHLFALTEAGADLFPHHYVRMTQRLLGEIVGLETVETAGRSGQDLARLIFTRMAERIATEYAPQVQGKNMLERARSAVSLIAREGIDFEVVEASDGVHLFGRGCPCNRLEEGAPAHPCEHDQVMLQRLLGGPVRPLEADRVPHDFHCGYRVAPSAAAG